MRYTIYQFTGLIYLTMEGGVLFVFRAYLVGSYHIVSFKQLDEF